jgi:hypothetical protein
MFFGHETVRKRTDTGSLAVAEPPLQNPARHCDLDHHPIHSVMRHPGGVRQCPAVQAKLSLRTIWPLSPRTIDRAVAHF